MRLSACAFCLIILLTGSSATATTCIAGKSFKVRQVCGQVKDFAGLAIPNATVQLRKNGDTDVRFALQTDNDGKFRFSNVADGDYELRVKFAGFWDAAQPFIVEKSRENDLCPKPIRVVMKPAGQCSYVENAWKKKDLR